MIISGLYPWNQLPRAFKGYRSSLQVWASIQNRYLVRICHDWYDSRRITHAHHLCLVETSADGECTTLATGNSAAIHAVKICIIHSVNHSLLYHTWKPHLKVFQGVEDQLCLLLAASDRNRQGNSGAIFHVNGDHSNAWPAVHPPQ